MVMLTRCDAAEEEDEGDGEGAESLAKGLTHQCSLALRVQGLPTGFCRDIHGQVCGNDGGRVLDSCDRHQSCCVLSWKCAGGGDGVTATARAASSSSTRSTIKERPFLLAGPPALFCEPPPPLPAAREGGVGSHTAR